MSYEHNYGKYKYIAENKHVFHLSLFFQKNSFKQKDIFQLKDMEKIAPKEKGISKYQRHARVFREILVIFSATSFLLSLYGNRFLEMNVKVLT